MDSAFHSCDFILTDGGAWKCARCFDGQMTKVPNGGDALAFCRGLSEAIERAPRTPDWVWCLTARVRDENRTGEDRRTVHGTRHFRPGTKVYLHPPNWDERVAAIGVPRYSDRLTRVVMDVRKLERFSLEKVDDKEIVTALLHPYRAWPYTRLAPTSVGRGSWDASDESKERILEDVEWLSRLDPDGRRWS